MSTWPRLAPLSRDDTARLIPGQCTEDAEHALADLADGEADVLALVALSAATNARLQAQEERHPGGLGRADMVFNTPYSKIVNAAFAYAGEGARFHGAGGRGVWYCAFEVETAIAEVTYHRVRHLRETGLTDEAEIPYRLFLADIHGQDFAWLDDSGARSRACLNPDSYGASQSLGADLSSRHAGGIVYPAVRRPGGTNVAVLQPPLVANVRRESLLRLTFENSALAHVAWQN